MPKPSPSETRRRILQEFREQLDVWSKALKNPAAWASKLPPFVTEPAHVDIQQVSAALADEGHPVQAKLLYHRWTNLQNERVYPLVRWTCGGGPLGEGLDTFCGPVGEPPNEFLQNPARSSEVLLLLGGIAEIGASIDRVLAAQAEAEAAEDKATQGQEELTLAEAAEKYDIPKSAFSKAAALPATEANYLRTRKVGRNRLVVKADLERWTKNYFGRRETRQVRGDGLSVRGLLQGARWAECERPTPRGASGRKL